MIEFGKIFVLVVGAGIFSLVMFRIADRGNPETAIKRFIILWLAVFALGMLEFYFNPDFTW